MELLLELGMKIHIEDLKEDRIVIRKREGPMSYDIKQKMGLYYAETGKSSDSPLILSRPLSTAIEKNRIENCEFRG